MIFFDFLCYYLTMWFSTAVSRQLSTPVERTCYALGISTFLYLLGIGLTIEYFITNSFVSLVPTWIYFLLCVALVYLYRYAYISRNRYELIVCRQAENRHFNISNKKGINLSIAFCLGSVVFMILLRLILTFYNKH